MTDLKNSIEESFITDTTKWRGIIEHITKMLNDKLNPRGIVIDKIGYNYFCRLYLEEYLKLTTHLKRHSRIELTKDGKHDKIVNVIILHETIKNLKTLKVK